MPPFYYFLLCCILFFFHGFFSFVLSLYQSKQYEIGIRDTAILGRLFLICLGGGRFGRPDFRCWLRPYHPLFLPLRGEIFIILFDMLIVNVLHPLILPIGPLQMYSALGWGEMDDILVRASKLLFLLWKNHIHRNYSCLDVAQWQHRTNPIWMLALNWKSEKRNTLIFSLLCYYDLLDLFLIPGAMIPKKKKKKFLYILNRTFPPPQKEQSLKQEEARPLTSSLSVSYRYQFR